MAAVLGRGHAKRYALSRLSFIFFFSAGLHIRVCTILGFESYEPEDCRETRLLGRFPMRNQYISDYIYRATGKRRSAKQVGSRLQQLRDTFHGKRRKLRFILLTSISFKKIILFVHHSAELAGSKL